MWWCHVINKGDRCGLDSEHFRFDQRQREEMIKATARKMVSYLLDCSWRNETREAEREVEEKRQHAESRDHRRENKMRNTTRTFFSGFYEVKDIFAPGLALTLLFNDGKTIELRCRYILESRNPHNKWRVWFVCHWNVYSPRRLLLFPIPTRYLSLSICSSVHLNFKFNYRVSDVSFDLKFKSRVSDAWWNYIWVDSYFLNIL